MYVYEIYKAAASICGGESEALGLLCQAAEGELRSRLRRGVSPSDCAQSFIAAAAILAVSMYCQVRAGEGGEASYKAGEVAVTFKSAEEAEKTSACLRRQAEAMLAPYMQDGGFCFSGVGT